MASLAPGLRLGEITGKSREHYGAWPASQAARGEDRRTDLKKALAERVLNAEIDHHLTGEKPGTRRNGYGKKTVVTDTARSRWRATRPPGEL